MADTNEVMKKTAELQKQNW